MGLDIKLTANRPTDVFTWNITHNLGSMADKAGIYKYLWRPEELDIETAGQLIPPLTKGLELLKSKPEYFKSFNPKNGWGNYKGLVNFVEAYLEACIKNPDAKIDAWR